MKQIIGAIATLSLLTGCIRVGYELPVERLENAQDDIAYLEYVMPTHELILDDLIEIALCRNLDLMIKDQEVAIQHELATGEKYQMLPNLVASGEYSERDSLPGSASQSLVSGVPPAPPSVSSERETKTYDFTLTWNLLDFGISYLRSRQEANREMIQRFECQRLKQNLINDLTRQYWQAIASQKGIDYLNKLIEKIRNHQVKLDANTEKRLISKTMALENQDRLLQMQLLLSDQERQYSLAMEEIRRLMGYPCQSGMIKLRDIPFDQLEVDFDSVRTMEEIALLERPELFIHDVQEHVDVDEARAAFLEMMPVVSLFGSDSHNENKFLLHNQWLTAGVRATWDLLAIPYHYQMIKASVGRQELTRRNRLALSMAAIAQVNIAYTLFLRDRETYLLSKELSSVKLQLATDAERRRFLGQFDEADVITYEVDAVQTYIQALTAYADIQVSVEQVNNAIGRPRYYQTKRGGNDRE